MPKLRIRKEYHRWKEGGGCQIILCPWYFAVVPSGQGPECTYACQKTHIILYLSRRCCRGLMAGWWDLGWSEHCGRHSRSRTRRRGFLRACERISLYWIVRKVKPIL